MLTNNPSFFCRSFIVNSSYMIVSFHMLTEAMLPILLAINLLPSFENTGDPVTEGSCKISPTNNMLIDPKYSSPEPPKSSSSCKCMLARFKFDNIETSSIIINFRERRLVRITYCATLDSGQYPALFPSCSIGSWSRR